MKRFMIVASTVAFFPVMVAADSWVFRTCLEMSYVDWYITNGTLISIAASLFAVVWKDLNNNEGLISANPTLFLAANLMLIGSHFQVIGYHLTKAGNKLQAQRPPEAPGRATYRWIVSVIPELLDGVAGFVGVLLIVSALTVWFVAIVPLQYFIVLIAGAPARLALKPRNQATNPDGGMKKSSNDSNKFGEWESNFVSAPVSFTNAVAALVILAIKIARGAA